MSPLSQAHSALCALRKYYRWTRILPAAAALGPHPQRHLGYLVGRNHAWRRRRGGCSSRCVDRVRQVVEEGGSLADAADALRRIALKRQARSSHFHLSRGSDVVRVNESSQSEGLGSRRRLPSVSIQAGVWTRLAWMCTLREPSHEAHGWLTIVRRSAPFAEKVLGEHADWVQPMRPRNPLLPTSRGGSVRVAKPVTVLASS